MLLTIVPDKVDRRKAAIIAENTIKQASYPEDDPRHEPTLRHLVETWISADCRFDKWTRTNPKEGVILSKEAGRWTLVFWRSTQGKPLPILSGNGRVGDRPRKINLQVSGYSAFVAFLLCAAPWFDVGICDRCKRFYWNRWGHRNKRFCRRQCSQRQNATHRQNERISKARRKKNASIRRAIDVLISQKPDTPDWKSWVATRAGVTRSYVTRTFNRGIQKKRDGLNLRKQQRAYLVGLGMRRKSKKS